MSLEFTASDRSRMMVVRIPKASLDSVEPDYFFDHNLTSLAVAFKRRPEIADAHEYAPRSESEAIVGTRMSDDSDAYRIEVRWRAGRSFDEARRCVEEIWEWFAKRKSPSASFSGI